MYSYYNRPPRREPVDPGESLTQQHFAADADINNIIAKYKKTGILGDPLNPGTRKALYGDFSGMVTYHEAQILVKEADEAFLAIPAAIRAKFGNDPGKLIAFLEDPVNTEEAIKLGLKVKTAPKEEPAVSGAISAPQASSAPSST